MQESTIEAYLRDEIKALGGTAYKFVSPGNSGVPDRLILLPHGVVAFAEVKASGETPRPLQERVHDRLRRLGFRVYAPDSKIAVDRMLYELLSDIKEVMPNDL